MGNELSCVVDALPGLVWTALPDGHIDFLNRRWCEYTGLEPAEACGGGWQTAIHPEDLPELLEHWRSNLGSGEPCEVEARLRRFDGEYRWFLFRTSPLTDASGQVVKWCGIGTDIEDRRRSEEALRGREEHYGERSQSSLTRALDELSRSEGRLRTTIDAIPGFVWSTASDGRVDFLNQRWCDYTGVKFENGSGAGWQTTIHPDDADRLLEFWRSLLESGQPGEIEARLCRFDGTFRWFLIRAVPLRDEAGHVVKWYGLNTDIEDLKQSQENLRKAEERTRLIIDTALDAVITIDAQGTITSWNKQAEIVFGWSNREAIGRRMSETIIPEQHRMAHERGLRHFLTTGDGPILQRRIEIRAVRRSGVEFPVELEIMPMRVGQDWIFSAFIRDITESKLAEEKLRENELNLRQMTETIPEMLWSASPDGAIDYLNARVLDYTGFSAEELMGAGWRKCIHPDDADRVFPVWMSCITTGAPYRVEVRTFHAADRTYRWCATSAFPLLDQQGRILKWHGTIVDMHDWKQAQEELRNTQEELAHMTRVMTMGELTASIAHEVNQPLSGIITNASTCLRMLAADPPNVDGARETARRTIRDGNRASDVITRLRALFSKKDATTESVDLNEATREVIALSLSELQRSRVILRPELADDLPPVTGDRVQLQQVILNLLLNASDAMSGVDDRPRQLVIRTERDEGDRVRLTVQDAGVGFEPQGVDKLFEAFYTTKSGGMGIGLSVSRSIIESHHGRLWAAPNDGPGATFSFSIPRAPRMRRRSLAPFGRRDGAQRHEEFVMVKRSLVSVVDDDESVRESLPDLLREFGFAVQAFSSAEEFLASDCVGQTRCLILDIAMPGMSGPDLQRELTLRRQEIPIVFITAHGDETVRPRLLEQGAVECLFKPFSDTALLEALNAALRVS